MLSLCGIQFSLLTLFLWFLRISSSLQLTFACHAGPGLSYLASLAALPLTANQCYLSMFLNSDSQEQEPNWPISSVPERPGHSSPFGQRLALMGSGARSLSSPWWLGLGWAAEAFPRLPLQQELRAGRGFFKSDVSRRPVWDFPSPFCQAPNSVLQTLCFSLHFRA